MSAAKVVDFSLASAKVESARGFIGISASIPNFLELFIKLRAAIQRAYETRRERECGLVKWLAESEWQDEPVQSVADKVPQGGGSDQRQEQEWPRFNTVVAHAVGKAICSSGKGKGVPFRDIDQTCATDRCVDGKTPERFCALSGFELHEEVKENNWLSEVIEKVAEANAYRFGDPVLIRECYRADERLVDGLRDLKGLNVSVFEWIANGDTRPRCNDDIILIDLLARRRCGRRRFYDCCLLDGGLVGAQESNGEIIYRSGQLSIMRDRSRNQI
ncbi:hypothetical protein V473_21730 [Sphingobium cupriresistens LL01]|uniref:Uncharacterized protein n=1 Tax=Sphingobium cupriresistens LL01 TaxID=1420583 RepID=A0A0J7XLC9_9SPHN|nr:hypothetical protein V473_21730 [Sphingobium cupriresistens LL01]